MTCFKTQGDANNAQDSFLIDEDRVIGTVTFGIPVIGYVVRFVQLRWYFILPIVIMIAIFFQLLKRYFIIGKDDEESGDDSDSGSKEQEGLKKSEEESEKAKPEDKPTEALTANGG